MKLFINYKRNVEPDQTFARALDEALKQAGFDVFRDETGIASGVEWAQVIQRHLEECSVVISLVSNASLQSSWVLNEIDFARKRGKFIIPVLMEPLLESVEFQEYIPRFRRTQHYTYRGDNARAAADVLARLRQSESLVDAQQFATPSYRYDADDDSENPAWRKFFEEHPHALVDGTVHLSLDDAICLAMLRSVYYQRNLAATDEPAVDRRPFDAYRQGFYTQVALGEFGLSAFAAQDASADGKGNGKKMGGYLGLLMRLVEAGCRRGQLAALKRREDVARARFEAGVGDFNETNEVLHATATRELELLERQIEIEQDLEDFKTYVLGIPAEMPLVLDDPIESRCRLLDPALEALRGEVMTAAGEINERRRNQQYDPNPQPSTEPLLSPESLRRLGELLGPLQERMAMHLATAERQLREATTTPGAEGLEETREELTKLKEEWAKEISGLHDAVKCLREKPASGPDEGQWLDLDWANLPATVEQFRRGSLERRRFEEHIGDHLDGLADFVERVRLVRARLAAEAMFPAPVEMSQEEAERLAAEHRPDREALREDVVLKRLVRQRVRRLLRELARSREQLQVARRAWAGALMQARAAYGRFFVGRVTLDEPARADVQLYDVQRNFLRLWFEFHADRIRLLRELGMLKIDDRGLWVDDSPPAAGRAASGDRKQTAAPTTHPAPATEPARTQTGRGGYVMPLLFLLIFATGFALGAGVGFFCCAGS